MLEGSNQAAWCVCLRASRLALRGGGDEAYLSWWREVEMKFGGRGTEACLVQDVVCVIDGWGCAVISRTCHKLR